MQLELLEIVTRLIYYLCGDKMGQIKQINSGTYGDDNLYVDINDDQLFKTIDLAWETPWLTFGNSNSLKQLRGLRINSEGSDQILKIDIYTNQNNLKPIATRLLDLNQPVWNRKIVFGSPFRTIKLIVNTQGSPQKTKINSLQFEFNSYGMNQPY